MKTNVARCSICGYHYNDGPSAVRYPRGNAVGVELTPLEKLPIGKGIVKRRGEKLAILNFGTLMPEAAKVAESLNATLVDMRFVKPLDEALILEMAASHEALVTVEENAIMGGAGSGVNEVLMAHRKPVPVLNIGLPDFFIPQGTQEEMRAELGLDARRYGSQNQSLAGIIPTLLLLCLRNYSWQEWQHAIQPLRKNRPSCFPTLPRLYDLWRARSR